MTANSDKLPDGGLYDNTDRERVLVVEDDFSTCRLIANFLRSGGLESDCVQSGPAALGYLAQNETPSLIMCDISMPLMNGIELCRRLKRNKRYCEIPLVVVSSNEESDILQEAFLSGASDYIKKPIEQKELLCRAKRLLSEHQRKKMDAARRKASESANEKKTRFLAVASHDLRNPLVSIRGLSQFLSKESFGPLTEGQREMVASINQASESMLQLVEDLLDISMLDLEKRPKLQICDLRDFAHRAKALHTSTASTKRISIVLDCTDQPAPALLDTSLFTRVVDNLLTNAIKFSEPETTARILVRSDADEVALCVEDEGPGIPGDEFDKLFKEFSRTSNQPTGGESSTGIGLYMSRNIVRALGGEIEAENRQQAGARFTVKFKRPNNEAN